MPRRPAAVIIRDLDIVRRMARQFRALMKPGGVPLERVGAAEALSENQSFELRPAS